jgi:hypothetical protein
VSPVKYELGFYIPEDDILHSHYRVHIKSSIAAIPSTVRHCVVSEFLLFLTPSTRSGWVCVFCEQSGTFRNSTKAWNLLACWIVKWIKGDREGCFALLIVVAIQ